MAGASNTRRWQPPGVVTRRLAAALGFLVLASVAVSVAWTAGAVPAPSAGAATSGRASVVVAPDTASPGQQVQVIAIGLPASKDAEIQLCGDLDLTGSADCALDAATGGPTSPTGTLTLPLTVEIPPAPCPCVVTVSVEGQAIAGATTAISVTGAPTGPLSRIAAPAADVQVVSLHVETPFDWETLVGGAPRGTLVLRLRNDGGAAAALPIATVEAGSGSGAATSLSPAALGPLFPGVTRTWTIPLSFPALDYGTIPVRVVIPLQGEHLVAVTHVADIPWIPLGVLALVLLLAGRAVARRIHRLRQRRHDRASATREVAQLPGPPGEPDADEWEEPTPDRQPMAGDPRETRVTAPAPVDGTVPALAGNSTGADNTAGTGNDAGARDPVGTPASEPGSRSTTQYRWEEEVWFMGREEPAPDGHGGHDGRRNDGGGQDAVGRDAVSRDVMGRDGGATRPPGGA